MRKYLALLILAALVGTAFADGGRLRFRKPAGSFIVTLFTTPDPLRQGRADFSVAVEHAGADGVVQDAKVTLTLTPVGGGPPITLHLSRAAATSRFLQAANFDLPHPGRWQVTVLVQDGAEAGKCSGEIEVLPPALLTNQLTWEIAAVPIVVVLFLVHQWRKSRYLSFRALGKQAANPEGQPLVTISNAKGGFRR